MLDWLTSAVVMQQWQAFILSFGFIGFCWLMWKTLIGGRQ